MLCRHYISYTFYFCLCQGNTTEIRINSISIILWYPFAMCSLNKLPCLVQILHSWLRSQHFLTYFDTSFCMYEMCYSEPVEIKFHLFHHHVISPSRFIEPGSLCFKERPGSTKHSSKWQILNFRVLPVPYKMPRPLDELCSKKHV